MADLNAASIEDVASFFKTYYAPEQRHHRHRRRRQHRVGRSSACARISSRFRPSRRRRRSTSRSRRSRRSGGSSIDDPLARLPRIDIGYRIPSSLSPDDDTIDVLREILAGGRSSRFYEHIVREQQLAVSVQAFAPNSRGPRLFGIEVTPAAERLARRSSSRRSTRRSNGVKSRSDQPTRRSSGRATRRGASSWAALSTSLSLARNLAEYALYYGDPGRINTRWDRLATFNAADVQRVARQYLTPENRTVVISHPKAAAGRGGAQ